MGGFHILGLFDWLASPYWAAVWCLWIAGLALVSLRATTRVPVPCITYVQFWGCVCLPLPAAGYWDPWITCVCLLLVDSHNPSGARHDG